MKATTAVAQTLTCIIGDVTEAVVITWKEKDDNPIRDGQEGYDIKNKRVNKRNVQVTTLTIEPSVLANEDTTLPGVWKCSAKSTQYPDSDTSPDQNVVVTFLNFGKIVESVFLKSNKPIIR